MSEKDQFSRIIQKATEFLEELLISDLPLKWKEFYEYIRSELTHISKLANGVDRKITEAFEFLKEIFEDPYLEEELRSSMVELEYLLMDLEFLFNRI
ncbi:MAG: hypothetical protein ACFFC7_23650 [Candidatus Hermodarchaeota archaeon]